MSWSGDCDDNATAERFFAPRKAELAAAGPWSTRAAVLTAIFERLEVGNNRQRRHSALAYRVPIATRSSIRCCYTIKPPGAILSVSVG